MTTDNFTIAGKEFSSRLIIGTGKYKNFQQTHDALVASAAEIITVALRRVNVEQQNAERLQDYIDPTKYTYLPNTAGCFTAASSAGTSPSRCWRAC